MENFRNRKLGVIPSPKDYRDFHITRLIKVKQAFPPEFTATPLLPEPYDQGDVGACVAYALKAIKEVQEHQERGKFSRFSAAYIYGVREENHYHGEGMVPREALACLLKRGVCREELLPGIYPYPVAVGMITDKMHQDAYPQRISTYAAIYTVNEIKSALMELGPILATLPVYDSFYQGGHLPNPNPIIENMYGFHSIVIVGWTPENRWLALNSWGKKWGELKGYFTLPFNYPFSELWSITDNIPRPDEAEFRLHVEPVRRGSRRTWLVHLGHFRSREEALKKAAQPLQEELLKIGRRCHINS